MIGSATQKQRPDSDDIDLTALQKLHAASSALIEDNYLGTLASLTTQVRRYQTILENISQGVCYLDSNQQLIASNNRYAKIYRLQPEDVRPGTTLREIAERRFAAGTFPNLSIEDYLSQGDAINQGNEPRSWQTKLKDGRTILICQQRIPDGGWVATHCDITERKNQSMSLQTLIDWVPDYLWVKDLNSRFVIVNNALADDCGRANTSDMIGLSDFDLHSPDRAEEFFASEQAIIKSGQHIVDKEELVTDANGATKWLSSTKVPLRDDDGKIFGLVGIARDITDRKRQDDLRNGQARVLEMIAMSTPLREVLDFLMRLMESQLAGLSCSILFLDKDGLHLRHGSAPNLPEAYCKAIDGVRIGPSVGSCGTAAHRQEPVIVPDIMTDPLWVNFRDLAAEHGFRSCWSTPIISHQGGVLGTFAMYSASVREPTADETRLINIATRIAGIAIERKQAEDRIQFLATHDALTGLPNRTLLKDRLAQAISHAERYDRRVSVVFIDLDNFKDVNDSLGHNAGDELLKTVARRMVSCIRSTDTVVRLGGDEFVIVLFDQPKNVDAIIQVLQKVRAAIAEPLHLEGHDLSVTGSIGLANYPDDGTDADTLLANADAAMYQAKEIGRDNFQFYTPQLNVSVHSKFVMQEELRNALARSELILDYQPQIDLRTGHIFAVEALVRWNHPVSGLVSPAKFIPLAEETGMIVPIGDWILHEACRQNKAWQNAGLPPIGVCVNVSARQFREKSWVSRVIHALHESGLEARYLELEITESLIMQDVDQAVSMMKQIQSLGVHIAIDDFGTGYSSLSALKNFPVARLKIDKSFVDEISHNENDRAVAVAVIMLGQKLNMRVIAEGVETDEQVEFLRLHNCDEMQGYHFSRPVSAKAVEQLLKIT